LVRRSALRLPLLGSKDFASRPFEASFLEADPDANRIAAMPFRVVIAGLAVVGASLFDIVDRRIKQA
jgi:hypothetical protein